MLVVFMVVTAVSPDMSHDAREVHSLRKLCPMEVTAVILHESNDTRDEHIQRKHSPTAVTLIVTNDMRLRH